MRWRVWEVSGSMSRWVEKTGETNYPESKVLSDAPGALPELETSSG